MLGSPKKHTRKAGERDYEGNDDSDAGHRPNSENTRTSSTVQAQNELPLFVARLHDDSKHSTRNRSGTLGTLATIPDTVKESITRVLPRTRADSDTSEAHQGMGWKMAACLMTAETISLGILSLAGAVQVLGFVPGILLIFGAGIVTTCNGKLMYLYRIRVGADASKDLPTAVKHIWGNCGRVMAEVLLTVFLVFLMAAHALVFNDMVRTLGGGTISCTVGLTILATVIMAMGTMPRTFKACSFFSCLSCGSILLATFTVIIDLAIHLNGGLRLQTTTSIDHGFARYAEVFLVVSNIVVSYTGHFAYFNIMNEMEDPQKDFLKALYVTNGVTIAMYIIAGAAIYGLAGDAVTSPALSSASDLGQKVAYGFAIPTIIVAGVIAGLVACQRIYTLVEFRCARIRQHPKSSRARAIWAPIVIALWLLSWVIANIIPFFSALLAVIGALCGTWICLGWPAAFWLWSLRRTYEGPRWRGTTYNAVASTMLSVCIVLSVLGMYGSVSEILFQIGQDSTDSWAPFTCASSSSSG